MTNEDQIRTIEDKIDKLPLVDAAVFEIISLLNDPDSNFEQIVRKLSADVAVRFLNMANSAYYGKAVSSIDHAVRLLGYSEMKQILITSILIDHFTRRLDFENFDFDKFQNQAHFCAAVSRVLGDISDYGKPQDLFTVAILHNIGKLVIAVYFKEEHKEIIALKKKEGITSREAEQRILGVSHSHIGAIVLDRFKIPRDISDAVRYHDTKDHVIPAESNFQLELISRESAAIVGSFSLPEGMDPLEITERLKTTIEEARKIYREGVGAEMRSKGFRKVFPSLLEEAGGLVIRDLKTFLAERVP